MPVSGVWKMSYNMESRVDNWEQNRAFLYTNGEELDEAIHYTNSQGAAVYSTSGRLVTLKASAGDKIEIKADRMDGWYKYVLFCADFISKM